jgi:hypothetical protein
MHVIVGTQILHLSLSLFLLALMMLLLFDGKRELKDYARLN